MKNEFVANAESDVGCAVGVLYLQKIARFVFCSSTAVNSACDEINLIFQLHPAFTRDSLCNKKTTETS